MKKHLIMATAAMAVVFSACAGKTDTAKTDTEATPATETAAPEETATVAVDTTGYTTTATGLMYKEIKPGTGNQPGATDVVTVHYTGKHLDGTTFDSSVERGEPTSFPLNRVIPGWTEGVQLMKVGAKYQFIIPSDLAYGPQGTPGGPIKPDETLYFEVELISIDR